MRASADGMLRYIRQELWEGRGWDGVYFDNLFTSFPPEYRALIANTTDQFDSAQPPIPPRPPHTQSARCCPQSTATGSRTPSPSWTRSGRRGAPTSPPAFGA